jgi:hypothetical protein
MELDRITQNALDHVRRNGGRYRRDYYSPDRQFSSKIEAIKQLRSETNAGLREAKDAIEAWEAEGKPIFLMAEAEAKILLKNLLLRGGQSGLTPLEVEAIRRLAE